MDQDCILLTKEGCFIHGICSGDLTDRIQVDQNDAIGRKGFYIGKLPEDLCGKGLRVYVEDEKVFTLIAKSWE